MELALSLLMMITPTQPIVGKWKYDGFIYDGQRYPLPNENLDLKFTFRTDGVSNLMWTRVGENGFCEREATYQTDETFLQQEVVWVNPQNNSDCQNDPDMQLGHKTTDRFEVTESNLFLHFNLNEKPFVYVLKKETN